MYINVQPQGGIRVIYSKHITQDFTTTGFNLDKLNLHTGALGEVKRFFTVVNEVMRL